MTALKILIVDDEPLMRLSMLDALEAVGHDVHAASTGTEGIDQVRKQAFDLVITDLRLPGADGLPKLIEKKTLTGHSGWIRSFAISPDGKVLVSAGDDQTMKFWDIATGRNFKTVKGHSGGIRCIAFSPDGRRLASASWDRTIKLWEGGAKSEE